MSDGSEDRINTSGQPEKQAIVINKEHSGKIISKDELISIATLSALYGVSYALKLAGSLLGNTVDEKINKKNF